MNYYTSVCTRLPISKKQFEWISELTSALSAELFENWKLRSPSENFSRVEDYLNNLPLSLELHEEYLADFMSIGNEELFNEDSSFGGLFYEQEDNFYIESEEYINLEVLGKILLVSAKKFGLAPIIIEYAFTASKSLPESIGGGALVISKQGYHYFYGGYLANLFVDSLSSKYAMATFLLSIAKLFRATPKDLFSLALLSFIFSFTNIFKPAK